MIKCRFHKEEIKGFKKMKAVYIGMLEIEKSLLPEVGDYINIELFTGRGKESYKEVVVSGIEKNYSYETGAWLDVFIV